MLPKKRRLEKWLIEKALRQGKLVRGSRVSLKYLVIPNRQSAFGLVVSSKVAKQAVIRNKLKRRGRAVILKLLPGIKEGFLALIFFKIGSPKATFRDLENEITQLFKNAKALN